MEQSFPLSINKEVELKVTESTNAEKEVEPKVTESRKSTNAEKEVELKVTESRKSTNAEKEDSRQYREEWKFIKHDAKATEDRVKNLIIDPNDPWGMWCLVCTKWAPQLGAKYFSSFVKDTKGFQPPRRKKESVNIHFSSRTHSRCLEKENSTLESSRDAEIYKKLTSMDKNVHLKMVSLMRTVFYFAIKDRPACDFASECHLQKMNGVLLGETYQNRISFTMLLKYVALYFKNKNVEQINNSGCISVLTDGSTTRKSTEYEAVLVRYVSKEDNKTKMSLVGICEIENANSEGLAKAISECLDKSGITNWQERLVCMTVDGASVNIGKHKGLVNMLQSPIHVHCYNHLLDLCLKDSVKSCAMAVKIMAILRSITHFYRTSPKLTRELQRAAEALDLQVLSFKPICETRWANSLESSVIAVLNNYQVIVQHLTNVVSLHSNGYTPSVKNSAKCILKYLLLYDVVFFLHAFGDFVELIARSSLYLEKVDINICDATDCVKKLQLDLIHFGSLGELITSNAKYLQTFLVTIDDTEPECVKFKNNILGTKNSIFTSMTRKSNSLLKEKKNSFHDLCLKASNQILQRFFSEGGPGKSVFVLMAQKLDTAMFPSTEKELQSYGESELLKICQVFKFPTERALAEWKLLRHIMFINFKPAISLPLLFEKLTTPKFSNFKICAELVQALLTISPSNAEVERIWSSVGNIIDDKSMSMSKETAENRLIIKHAKVPLENFDPNESIELWWNDSIRSRRPCFKD